MNFVENLPDVLFVEGVCEAPTVKINGEAVQLPRDLSRLLALCETSSFGKNETTVVDEKFRKSVETQDVTVEWRDLSLVLERIGKRLAPNMDLTAKFYKLIVYKEGSFFKTHRDTVRDDAHRLTLAVDLGSPYEGGDVHFWSVDPLRICSVAGETRVIDEKQFATRVIETELFERMTSPIDMPPTPSAPAATASQEKRRAQCWRSRGVAGAYAAWFTSSWHAVDTVKSGTRVVLTFDVHAVQSGRTLLPWRVEHATNVDTSSLFTEFEWRFLCEWLDLRTHARLASTCKFLRGLLGEPAYLASSMWREKLPALRRSLYEQGLHSIGFVLRHGYMCRAVNGEHRKLPAFELKGRDRLLAESLRIAGLLDIREKIVQYCVLQEEVLTEDSDDEQFEDDAANGPISVIVGQTVLPREAFDAIRDYRYRNHDEEHSKGKQYLAQIERIVGGPVTDSEVEKWTATQTELDDQLIPIVVPHRGVCWMTSDLDRCFVASYDDSDEPLWGNQRHFGLFRYSAAALIVRILNEEDSPPVVGFQYVLI